MHLLRPQRDDGFVAAVVLFLVVSVIAGVLVAGLVLPVAGGVGLAARSGTEVFEELPAELRVPPLAQNSVILAANGSRLATFYDQNRIAVPLKGVAPVMQQALVAIEDARFYEHGGVDLRGTLRAFLRNREGEQVQGGSTLTQQYVKNVLVESAQEQKNTAGIKEAKEKSYQRKLRELRYAIAIEEQFTKQEILERYLNISYFGSGAYGIEAASRRYFAKSASKLTLPEAATLAGLVQAPNARDPISNPPAAQSRRNVVLQRMADVGYITQAVANQAKATPLRTKPTELKNGCESAAAPFFCDYVLNVVRNDPVFGKTRAVRLALLFRGGLTIRTTLDPQAQKSAQRALAEFVEPTNKVASALAVVQPGTGQIKAMAVSRGFGDGKGQTKVNLAADSPFGGSRGFQSGSTFKPFVAAAALEKGYGFNYTINSPYQKEIGNVEACEGTLRDPWRPANESRSENGNYTLRTGMQMSVNTYFAQLEERVGVCRPAQIAAALGVKRADNGKPLEQVKSFVLGTNPVSPLDMAEAYATFGANGVHCEPIAITEITNRAGKRLAIPQPDCHQAMDPSIAAGVTALLRGVIDGPGPRTGARMALGRPAAGKTGTTDSRISVWFIGYTPNLATAVWAGNPSPPAGGYPLVNRTIGGRQYGNICGGCLPGPIWKMTMDGALKGVPVSNFVSADTRTFNSRGDNTVPDVRGMSRGQAINALEDAGLSWRIASGRRSSRQPAETVAFTDPGAGDTVTDGQRVTIFISGGRSNRADARPTATPAARVQSGAAPAVAPTAFQQQRTRVRRGDGTRDNRGGGGGGDGGGGGGL